MEEVSMSAPGRRCELLGGGSPAVCALFDLKAKSIAQKSMLMFLLMLMLVKVLSRPTLPR